MATEKKRTTFPNVRIVSEGVFVTPQGDQIQTIYVDLLGELQTNALCLVKASEPQFNLATTSSIRLSRPPVFREMGEVLIKDDQEGRVQTSTTKTVETQTEEAAHLRERTKAINVAMELCRTKMSANAKTKTKETNTTGSSVTFGTDWIIYCTSICPGTDEEGEWRATLPESYTSVTHIHRPTQFAQGLGLSVCEHIGVSSKPTLTRATFDGFRTVEVPRRTQMVLHGPMLYVDDPYRCIAGAEAGWPTMCALIFVKSQRYAAQKEYRFALLSIKPNVGNVFDLPMSSILKDCLLPVTFPEDRSDTGRTEVSIDDSTDHKKKVSPSGYTYYRRIRRGTRKDSNWRENEDRTDQSSEEVIEETVTSPDEIPEPFPAQEEKPPDVILFEQCDGKLRYIHRAYREENRPPRHWRIETARENAVVGEGAGGRVRPESLILPRGVRLESLHEHPIDPRRVLDLCLNPSAPKRPMAHEGFSRCSRSEIGHILACRRSLGVAVDLLTDTEQEQAAASAWYAFRFILDLVALFGPIVRSVCIIREYVAVVELERAPLSEAVAWATFSGTGTYSLYIDDGNTEELVASEYLSRRGSISPGAYIDALQRNGWKRKG